MWLIQIFNRRERNRIHAKKTRDRKKQFLETGESIIEEMVTEGKVLREYLISLNMLSPNETFNAAKRQELYRSEMSRLKVILFILSVKSLFQRYFSVEWRE